MSPDVHTLPLHDLHKAAGARFGAFAGWNMPITYPLGVLKEHLWTREHAGLFDISHMRLFAVEGEDAARLLSHACPIEAAALPLGACKLTFFLSDTAGILDDLIVTRVGEKRFIVVANAGNAQADEAHLRSLAAGLNCTVASLDRVILALQGPAAAAVLASAGIDPLPPAFMTASELFPDWFVSRTGYTGEDGFEIALPEAAARELVAKLLADERVAWIGLAARDSLRLEAGLCLHGQDITAQIDPASAGLLWTIPKARRETGTFLGADALRTILASPTPTVRVGLKGEGRQPVRAGTPLVDADGAPAGSITSGGFGPSANAPVAMGYVPRALAQPGTRLFAEVRGARVPVSVQTLPFVPHRFRKG